MVKYELILAIIAGILFGIAAILTKLALVPTQEFSIFSLQDWKLFIFSWPFVGLAIFGILSVVFLWWGFSRGRAIITISIFIGFSALVSVTGGVLLFGESLSVIKAFGIITITLGVIFLQKI